MKTFDYTINGVKYHVEVVSIKEDRAEVRVNGASYDVELDRAFDIDQEQDGPQLLQWQPLPKPLLHLK